MLVLIILYANETTKISHPEKSNFFTQRHALKSMITQHTLDAISLYLPIASDPSQTGSHLLSNVPKSFLQRSKN